MLTSFLVSVAISSAAAAGLPLSLHPGALSACMPATLEAAEDCLTRALSKEDLATLEDQTASAAYRGSLDCELEIAWHLGDPSSPMAKAMHDKISADIPSLAAAMIIQDIQMRATGSSLPWDQIRQDAANIPPGAHLSSCPSQTKSEGGNAN